MSTIMDDLLQKRIEQVRNGLKAKLGERVAELMEAVKDDEEFGGFILIASTSEGTLIKAANNGALKRDVLQLMCGAVDAAKWAKDSLIEDPK